MAEMFCNFSFLKGVRRTSSMHFPILCYKHMVSPAHLIDIVSPELYLEYTKHGSIGRLILETGSTQEDWSLHNRRIVAGT